MPYVSAAARSNPATEGTSTEDERKAAPIVALCCRMLGLAFSQVEALAKPQPKGARWRNLKTQTVLHDAREAHAWIMRDNRMHILSYTNCCEALGVNPERGRKWVRSIMAQL